MPTPRAKLRARLAWLSLALALGGAAGCLDYATIGGLCLDCGPGMCVRGVCAPQAGASGCSGRACAAAGSDACAANGCTPDAGAACREGAFELTRMRLDLMFVVDDSASLAPWWPALHDGLDQFIHQDEVRDVGVGLQRFDEVCDAQAYKQPIVPIAPLSANASTLQGALQLMEAASTSTIPALDGALQYARSWATAHTDVRVAVVLLTDASPGACDGLIGNADLEAQRIARAAYEGNPSIKTYVIGFSVLGKTEALAKAGGTEQQMISVSPVDGEVRVALDAVRKEAQPCAFRWPSGRTPAPNAAVVLTAADGSQRSHPIVPNAASCDQQLGFYVEDPAAAFALVACPRLCANLGPRDKLALSSTCSAP